MLPQRYVFSSKSQRTLFRVMCQHCCCCYHKGTYFQANHNENDFYQELKAVVVATTKVRIFKQITTQRASRQHRLCCCCYHKGTYFQANHNNSESEVLNALVVVATTKVRIFKQITTRYGLALFQGLLLLLPQRYVFSSKSQQRIDAAKQIHGCCCYHKGTYFQANHNKKNEYGKR